jgi:hypothetical protein
MPMLMQHWLFGPSSDLSEPFRNHLVKCPNCRLFVPATILLSLRDKNRNPELALGCTHHSDQPGPRIRCPSFVAIPKMRGAELAREAHWSSRWDCLWWNSEKNSDCKIGL